MTHATFTATTAASTTYDGLTATMAELRARLESMPRDVFVYPGPIDAFKADLAASGVEMRDPAVRVFHGARAPAPFGLSSIGGLECWEVDGQVWVAGSYRDFRDARDGKIPVKLLKPGPGEGEGVNRR
jgi:hypothetical protein